MSFRSPYKGKNKSIGILGGTFNPVHMGHMHMAKMAAEHMGLDRVVFLLCALPAHKKLDYNVSPKHRLKMLRMTTDIDKKYFIDDYEVNLKNTTYTYQSLQRIKDLMDETSKLYFIIGADSLMQLDCWKNPEIFFRLAEFIVIPRGNFTTEQCNKKIVQLQSDFDANIHYIDCEKFDMSSTKIRDGRIDDDEYIDEDVYKYISKKGLYNK